MPSAAAKLEEAPPPIPTRMRVGAKETASGLQVMAGIPEIDYLDALAFPEYLQEFQKVANHPQVAKELRANTLPIMGAEWTIEPASDDARDQEIAEFAAANVLSQTGETFGRQFWQRGCWNDHLRDILRFLQNGFSVFQKILRHEGRFVVLDRLKYLMPWSIERWNFDETDQLLSIRRTYIDATGRSRTGEVIDAADLIVYTWDQEGSNILGKPLIRPMWGPYRMMTRLELLEVVDKQKTAVGALFFQLQENPATGDDEKAEQLMKSMRSGDLEKIYAVLKHGQDFGWKEGGTQTKGLREIIEGKQEQIAKVGQSTMSELGLAESGSRGTAGAKGAFEAMLHSAIASTIAEQVQRLVNEVVDLNWPNVSDYPRVRCSKIDPFEQTRNIPEFINAISAGAVDADLDTENEIRRRYGFMERAEGSAPPPGRRSPYEPGSGPGEEEDEPKDPGDDRASNLTGRIRLASREAARAGKVDADRIRGHLEQFEGQYLQALRDVQADMRTAVLEAIASGKEPKKPTDIKVPFVNDLRDRLLAILRSVRDFGRAELVEEMARQMKSAGRVSLEANPQTRAGAISAANRQAQVVVELNISDVVHRLQSQAALAYNRLVAEGLTGDALIKALQRTLDETSERQITDMSRDSTSVSFNGGRNVAVQELKDDLDPFVVRTEILDENTCGPCEKVDGKRVQIDSPEYLRYQPPALCEGRRRCRGFYIAFPK